MKKWLTAGAKSGNLGESSTALETVTRERIQSVSQQFFTEIWGLGESRQRGAPSYEYKKRVEARDALVKAFLEQYDTAKAPTGDSGIEKSNPRGARRQWRGKREMCWREERERMTMNMKRSPPPPPPKTMTTVTRIS